MPAMDFVVTPQAEMRPGIIELRWGDPDPALMPVDLVAAAAEEVLRVAGREALNYGANEGPEALRAALVARLARDEGGTPALDEIAVTNGNSPALHQLTARLVRPGDVVLVEDPGFSLALRIFRDLGVGLAAVPFDDGGLDVDRLPGVLARVRAEGGRPRLLYTVPTFHNPTGVSLAQERRRRLVELAVADDLLVVEDDVYRELWYGTPAPPSLWSIAAEVAGGVEHVIRLGSFSKSLAPGLRCGFLTGPADVVERLTDCGLLDSAGCLSQFTSLIVAALLRAGSYDDNVARLRRVYGERRDALVGGLRAALPMGCGCTQPEGGFFLWVSLPAELSAARLLPFAEAAGVSFFGGERFSLAGDDDGLRLGFSMYGPDELVEGAARLGRAVDRALQESRR
jgi:DNA-binding transcriptional MocR family regulator